MCEGREVEVEGGGGEDCPSVSDQLFDLACLRQGRRTASSERCCGTSSRMLSSGVPRDMLGGSFLSVRAAFPVKLCQFVRRALVYCALSGTMNSP